jgi:hypothetical protein
MEQIDESLMSNRWMLGIKQPAKGAIFHAGSLALSIFYPSIETLSHADR